MNYRVKIIFEDGGWFEDNYCHSLKEAITSMNEAIKDEIEPVLIVNIWGTNE